MPVKPAGRAIHRWFDVGAWFKGIEGAFEIILGVGLAIDREIVQSWLFRVAAKDLLHDPQDRIATALRHAANDLGTGGLSFATLYLVAHGVVKVVLAIGLLREKRWAFPFALVALTALAAYQLYRFSHTHAIVLPFAAALDLAIAWLVWRESRNRAAAATVSAVSG